MESQKHEPTGVAGVCQRAANNLDLAIANVIEQCDVSEPEIARLIQKAGEASGLLRMHAEVNLVRLTYDFVRTAAGGGPDDEVSN